MITEEMMAAAAAEMNEAMLRSLPEPEDCYHEFSAKFEKKMKRVIYRADHPLQFRVLQKVASIILVLFLGFATIMTISPTVRARVFGWIREQYESFIAYYFVDEPSVDGTYTTYYISGLPSDYAEIGVSDSEGIYTAIYANPEGNALYFSYSTSPSSANYFLKEEGYEIRQISIHNHIADLYLSVGSSEDSSIIWCDEDTSTIFFLSSNIAPDELIELAKSVMPK
jgi:hypothetical protein